MNFFNIKNIDYVWGNICKHEGEIFYTTKRKKTYTYTIINSYLVIANNPQRGRISKEMIENALKIENPTPKKISGWAPSYICGIITDSRIV